MEANSSDQGHSHPEPSMGRREFLRLAGGTALGATLLTPEQARAEEHVKEQSVSFKQRIEQIVPISLLATIGSYAANVLYHKLQHHRYGLNINVSLHRLDTDDDGRHTFVTDTRASSTALEFLSVPHLTRELVSTCRKQPGEGLLKLPAKYRRKILETCRLESSLKLNPRGPLLKALNPKMYEEVHFMLALGKITEEEAQKIIVHVMTVEDLKRLSRAIRRGQPMDWDKSAPRYQEKYRQVVEMAKMFDDDGYRAPHLEKMRDYRKKEDTFASNKNGPGPKTEPESEPEVDSE